MKVVIIYLSVVIVSSFFGTLMGRLICPEYDLGWVFIISLLVILRYGFKPLWNNG